MKTLEETFDLINQLNDEAHTDSYESWTKADNAEDSDDEDQDPEYLRELASEEQSEYFRDYFYDLDVEDQEAIKHWLNNDEDFKEQFQCYFGYEDFIANFKNTEEG